MLCHLFPLKIIRSCEEYLLGCIVFMTPTWAYASHGKNHVLERLRLSNLTRELLLCLISIAIFFIPCGGWLSLCFELRLGR